MPGGLVSRRLGRGAAADVFVVLGTFLVLGLLCGVLWWLLVEPAEFVRGPRGGLTMSEVELSQRFNADGWYSVIALVAGFLSGLALTWWRSRDLLLTTALLLPGAAVAALAMARVGGVLGPGEPEAALVQQGEPIPVQLTLLAASSYLMWPIGVLFGAVMVLWSSARVPGEDDGLREGQWPQEPPDVSADPRERTAP
jgi:hypothetical protein